jgi:hypothetical protein
MELRKRINELEVSLQKALNLLESDNWKILYNLCLKYPENHIFE